MRVVALRLRREVRRRWRSWIGLALLIGVGAGGAMALVVGARRTGDAYPRFASAQRAADVVLTGRSTFGLVGAVDLDQVERLPAVEETARAFVGVPFAGRISGGPDVDTSDIFPVATRDASLGREVEAWHLVEGRAADPDRVDEAVASFELADRLDIDVGTTIDFHFYAAPTFTSTAAALVADWPNRLAAPRAGELAPSSGADGPRVPVRVVGIEASPAEFPPLNTDLAPVLHLTPAFHAQYQPAIVGSDLAYVRLRPGADLQSFQRDVEELGGGEPVSFVATRAIQTAKVQRAIDIEANVLAIVAALVALVAGIAIVQAVVRQTRADQRDDATLRALGMDGRQSIAMVVARAGVIAAMGAVLAVTVAVTLSPLIVLPLARRAELDPGVHLDWIVLGAGVLIVLVTTIGVAVLTARRRSRRAHARRGAPRLPSITRPLTAFVGIRFVLGRRELPALGAILGVAAGVAMFVGAFTFTGNLDRQLDDPHRYGLNWDQKIGAPGLPDVSSVLAPALVADPQVDALALGTVTMVLLEGERVDVLALEQLKGAALPTIVSGRAPTAPDEIAVGARTLRSAGADVGDTVDVQIGSESRPYTVVGQAVFPEFGDAGQLGAGALTTFEGLQRVLPTALRNTYLTSYRDTGSIREQREHVADAVVPYPTREDARPEDLIDLARGDGLLTVLAGALGVLAFAVILHAIVSVTRAGRRDFAVLRALGMQRMQACSVVAWQVAVIASGAAVIGLPLGVVLGQCAWRRFATSLGVATDAAPYVAPIAAALVGLIAISIVAAVVPTIMATRSRRATALLRTQ